MRNLKFILFITVIILGCKEEFIVRSNGSYNEVLNVEGFVSNEDPPYIIELSLSTPVDNLEKNPYQGCIVTLLENNNKSEILKEIEPGKYYTSTNGIKGTVGNEYHISIQTPNGKMFESAPQIMPPPIGIDTVYAKLVYKDDINYVIGLPGYQFYVSSETAINEDNYILWNLEETYEYTSIHELFGIFNDGTLYTGHYDLLEEYQNKYRCWNTSKVNNVYTAKTSNLTVPQIESQPLLFVGTDTRKLQERYSLLVRQYSVSKESYYFWQNIEEQFKEKNILSAYQPYNIKGNMYNIDNPNEIVFGNFTVGSVTKRRIFVDSPTTEFYYITNCSINDEYTLVPPPVFVVVDLHGDLGSVKEGCIDCTYFGGVTEKPDFWIDK